MHFPKLIERNAELRLLLCCQACNPRSTRLQPTCNPRGTRLQPYCNPRGTRLQPYENRAAHLTLPLTLPPYP